METEAARNAKESLELACQMSNILETGLDRHTLSLLIALYDRDLNPEALTALVRELVPPPSPAGPQNHPGIRRSHPVREPRPRKPGVPKRDEALPPLPSPPRLLRPLLFAAGSRSSRAPSASATPLHSSSCSSSTTRCLEPVASLLQVHLCSFP